jgi:uridylate kinase
MFYIISLGGSVIVPDKIDIEFLKRFKKLILNRVKKGDHFIIVTGGGMTARNYQNAARAIGGGITEDFDWLGIHSTRLNGHLLATIFRTNCQKKIITDPIKDQIEAGKKIVVAAGWRPGWSTDYVCTILAKKYKIKTIINLSNISCICNKDPRKFKDAKPLGNLNWKEFKKICGGKWRPGLNSPFDPVASRLTEKLKIKVLVIQGNDLVNFESFLSGNNFKGTVIENKKQA